MTTEYDGCEWQQQGIDWVFGWKIRGVIRSPIAEIHFQEDLSRLGPASMKNQSGWAWMVRPNCPDPHSGLVLHMDLTSAIEACEKALGLDV